MDNINTDETNELIASDKVTGTHVYNRDGENLGTITKFMVNKVSGEVEYAVLSFGGFLGMGRDHYPLPWDVLEYSEDKSGYIVDLDKSVLENAPRYSDDAEPRYNQEYGRKLNDYYGVPHAY